MRPSWDEYFLGLLDGISRRATCDRGRSGATLYCKMVPCFNCARRIVRVGIKKVVAQKAYHADKASRELFTNAKVDLIVVDDSIEEYEK